MKSVAESGLPWLVALYRGIVVGYCYATLIVHDSLPLYP
jgi:phosphinothricin acetyltransferase